MWLVKDVWEPGCFTEAELRDWRADPGRDRVCDEEICTSEFRQEAASRCNGPCPFRLPDSTVNEYPMPEVAAVGTYVLHGKGRIRLCATDDASLLDQIL